LAQLPKIVAKDLAPGIHCCFFVSLVLISLRLFDKIIGSLDTFEIPLLKL
jgi:hypothetical protein